MGIIESDEFFDPVDVTSDLWNAYKSLKDFQANLKSLLFGDDYAERMTPDQLTDDKLLEAVRMLKEVY